MWGAKSSGPLGEGKRTSGQRSLWEEAQGRWWRAEVNLIVGTEGTWPVGSSLPTT